MRRIGILELLDSPSELASLARVLRNGGVAAIPTETSYGLAADPLSRAGVQRVLAIKRRAAEKPLPVLFGQRRQLASLPIVARADLLDRFFALWPSPLTVILPLSTPIPASCDAFSLGVRMPVHSALRELLVRVGPVTGTSLNRSGEAPTEHADQVERLLAGEVDVLVDGGRTPGGLASTLLDATREPPVVLRQGAFRWSPDPP